MARSRSPELVEYADLIRFEQDGRSLNPGNRRPYGERMIHGATPGGLSDREVELSRATQFSPLALDRAWEYLCLRAGGRDTEPLS